MTPVAIGDIQRTQGTLKTVCKAKNRLRHLFCVYISRKNNTSMYSNFRNNTSYTKANPNYPKNVFLNSQFQLNLPILIIDEVHNKPLVESNEGLKFCLHAKYFSPLFSPLLPPATKLGQGYIFTGICDSVHGGAGTCSRGVCSRESAPGVYAPGGRCLLPGGAWRGPPGTATAAGGTHPTGMHSCFLCQY